MKKKTNKKMASLASVGALLAICISQGPISALAAGPIISMPPVSTLFPNGMGTAEYIGYITGLTEKLGAQGLNAVSVADRVIPVLSVLVSAARAAHAGEVSKKEGYGFADGAIDNLIYQGGWGLAPGYIETNKAVLGAFANLGNDPSLQGSYLYDQVHQQQEATEEQNKEAAARLRAAEEELGKELYGPSYRLPANWKPE